MNDAVIFWSYAHRDDEADSGGITHLASRIANEYSLLTGRDLDLFVDKKLKWGELWRERIDSSLAASTYLIPVLTPRYFQRDECRKELREFHAQAKARGVADVLLPILYAEIEDFSSENPDELIALASRSQYADWRELRVKGPESAEYREELNTVAKRLVEVTRRVTERQLQEESDAPPVPEEQRFYDILETVKAKLPTLIEAVEQDRVTEAQYLAQLTVYNQRMDRLRRAGRAGAVPAVLQELGRANLPFAQRHAQLARHYNSLALELDPLMSALFRAAKESSEEHRLLLEIVDDIEDIYQRIQSLPDSESPRVTKQRQYAEKSRTWREIVNAFDSSSPFAVEGNALVSNWRAQATQAMGGEEEHSNDSADLVHQDAGTGRLDD
ncbi:TIR domain-containing protein [Modestobacter sp. VKM Ac-2977]|uniref:TIR domain-containing protein n=1 Tax=Modestobacter sp. VKM Ac-2977 TaxID=3004131 RepID=UPI0022AA58D0|nr:TIR domain-containing protein [Modestobacter sp. VKM Ac-2977]MCZ2821592.1 TIR domain-containing protein [Modestobacter sp. VKM Ac-2977]